MDNIDERLKKAIELNVKLRADILRIKNEIKSFEQKSAEWRKESEEYMRKMKEMK